MAAEAPVHAPSRRRRGLSGDGAAALGLACAVVVLSVLTLGAVLWPGAPAAQLAARLLPIPDAAAFRARQAMTAAPGKAPDYAAAAHAFRDELGVSPLRTEAWLGLAYAEQKAARDRFSPAAREALARSYDLAPFEGSVFTWRLGYALRNWEGLDPATRRAALDELGAVWEARPDLHAQILEGVRETPDAAGRAAALAVVQP